MGRETSLFLYIKHSLFWESSNYSHGLEICRLPYRMAHSRMTHFRRHFRPKGGVGGRVCTSRKRCHVISNPVRWQWIGGVCRVLLSDEKCVFVSGIIRPVRPPDLTVQDFFLCGYLKEHEYTVIAHTQYNIGSVLFGITAVEQNFWLFCHRLKTIFFKWSRPPSRCYLSKMITK
jgi:hypothetical protein